MKKKKPIKKNSPEVQENHTHDGEFHITWVDFSKLKLWEANPRHNDEAAEELAEIIRKNGLRSPMVAWKKNMTIYKGNTTFKACRILGLKKVPVIFHDFPSRAAAEAYGIADNKGSELAVWDDEALLKIMSQKEFKEGGHLEKTGFSSREVELLDFWPPTEDQKKKAKKEKKKLTFRIVLECEADHYQEHKKFLENWCDNEEGIRVR